MSEMRSGHRARLGLRLLPRVSVPNFEGFGRAVHRHFAAQTERDAKVLGEHEPARLVEFADPCAGAEFPQKLRTLNAHQGLGEGSRAREFRRWENFQTTTVCARAKVKSRLRLVA